MKHFTKISKNHNRYLLNCDLLNKYNLKCIREKPMLKKITLDFPLEDTFAPVLEQIKTEVLAKNFLNFYCFNCIKPYISFKIREINSSKLDSKKYSLKISISKISNLEDLLFILFTENWMHLKLQDFIFFNKDLVSKKHFLTYNTFSYNLKVPIHKFIEIEEFVNLFDSENTSKEIPLYISFSFKNPLIGQVSNSSYFLKNIDPFWVTD